jgi:hypothetical protein
VNINSLEPEAAKRLEMNDIAAVEFESSSPLFFDSYLENRATGSFIVIDPLTNATLGAGMIRENLSQDAEILTARETQIEEAHIMPFERHRRHGHYPAIILVNARAEVVRQLERALFEAGFEVMLVEKKASFISTTWATLHAAGFVVLYQNPSPGSDERADLRAVAEDHFFDLADLDLLHGGAEAVEQVLALAETLRIPAATENPRKAV